MRNDVSLFRRTRRFKLDTPNLRRPLPVAERLERDLHFDRPSPVEAPRPDIPHRIPIAIKVHFVADLEVEDASDRIDQERDRIAAVVERCRTRRQTYRC